MALCLRTLNKRFEDKPLAVSVSKIAFIELIKGKNPFEKEERALYKNLESLEKKKLIVYQNKRIFFTKKGLGQFRKINEQLAPFFQIKSFYQDKNLPFKRKLQTMINEEKSFKSN